MPAAEAFFTAVSFAAEAFFPAVSFTADALFAAVFRVFAEKGAHLLQPNCNSVEELLDAQAHPEKYENLQVRVCGWNVRWNDLSKTEQDAYIRRAENVMQAF